MEFVLGIIVVMIGCFLLVHYSESRWMRDWYVCPTCEQLSKRICITCKGCKEECCDCEPEPVDIDEAA